MLMETDPQVSTSEHSFMWERLLKISNSIPYKKETSIFFDDGKEKKQKKMVYLYSVEVGGSKWFRVTSKYTYFQGQNTEERR